ncbi:recombination protein NinG [Yersinia enterocolitica]|uniref:recombination protein NinG n=1 Tax=Yersinia enterocolitica TaxID=630 RepID=UPI003F445980
MKPRKPKNCKMCGDEFIPLRPFQHVCGGKCAIAFVRKNEAEKKAKERADKLKIRRRNARPLSHWIALTQRVVNDLRRETCLANGDGCISCGTHNASSWHAGHFRTTASASHLRFTHDNIWLQCSSCNVYKSGNIGRYRRNLVRKIGEERVLALENDNRTHRWTVEELEQIRKQARADLRALKKGQMSKVA